jgi:hypothetical protein
VGIAARGVGVGVGVAVGLAVAVGKGVEDGITMAVESGVAIRGEASTTVDGVLVGDTADLAVRNTHAVNA